MKKMILLGTAVVTVAAMSFTIGDPLQIGSTMPKSDVKMKNITGKDLAIKDVKQANGVLVMFSCNTCPYVIKNQERSNAISEYAGLNKIGVIILNSNEAYRGKEDSYDAMKAYANDQKYKWAYVVDKNHEVADAFGLQIN